MTRRRRAEINAAIATPEALADEVAAHRPLSDPTLEQFHLQSGSLAAQARLVARRFADRSILFLGDDDHVSVIASAISQITATVVEVDPRICASLGRWKSELNLVNLHIINSDVRNPNLDGQFESFYGNPPFSSKNEGHGIRYWISRATDLCASDCSGIIAMPVLEGSEWVDHNWLDLQGFLTDNGYRIVHTSDTETQSYETANDLGLRSQNVFVRRVDSKRRLIEAARPGEEIYR